MPLQNSGHGTIEIRKIAKSCGSDGIPVSTHGLYPETNFASLQELDLLTRLALEVSNIRISVGILPQSQTFEHHFSCMNHTSFATHQRTLQSAPPLQGRQGPPIYLHQISRCAFLQLIWAYLGYLRIKNVWDPQQF